jgi:ADP-ribose pyrophosphatase YjhB (NUDIX family)
MGHIHSNSEYDFTVSAVIIHNSKILMLFHKKLQLWLAPAGHVELNETPIEALYREVQEETGLSREDLTLISPYTANQNFERDSTNKGEPVPFDIESHAVGSEGHRHIDLGYILASDTDKIVMEDAAEQLQWVTLAELEQLSPMPKIMYSRAHYALQLIQEHQS